MEQQTNLEKVLKTLQQVYGTLPTSVDTTQNWKPKRYGQEKARYLWTDAFGVVNFLSLYNQTKNDLYLYCADGLIEDVHNTLGKDRTLTHRLGSATDDHPTLGGLRIGKTSPEGSRDGDGQYFHYLTKWMFALNRMSRLKNDAKYNNWAIELAKAVHNRFVYKSHDRKLHMYWKISIDMSKPWVNAEGNLDPFDGYVTYRIIQEYHSDKQVLSSEISDMESMAMAKYKRYTSSDSLDLGEALWTTHWFPDEDWSKYIASESLRCLNSLYQEGEFHQSARARLAFREFGLIIGIQCNSLTSTHPEWNTRAQNLLQFWEQQQEKRDNDITPVMYCSALIPGLWM